MKTVSASRTVHSAACGLQPHQSRATPLQHQCRLRYRHDLYAVYFSAYVAPENSTSDPDEVDERITVYLVLKKHSSYRHRLFYRSGFD
ncbi:MAG: hypothetical protein MRJ52_03175 [Nitrosomonas sp.]|nr:hypothetical protein [Nitrosomonas sp.]